MKIPHRCFVEVTTECNLRCNLCKLWQQKDPINQLSLQDKLKFLEKLFSWIKSFNPFFNREFSIIMTGGEPFLKADQVLQISKKCNENNINSYVNTNGSLIEPFIIKILNSGLSAINISLDSHISEIHDKLRNLKGLFEKVINVIKTMVQGKEKESIPMKICVQSILGKWNMDSLNEHVLFFKDLGIDGIMFQPIQYPFGLNIPSKWHENFEYFPNSEDELETYLNDLLKLKSTDDFIMNSKEEIELWKLYFKDPEFLDLDKNPCKSYEQNLIIDVQGNAKFCFNLPLNPQNVIGNILTDSLEDLWNGNEAIKVKNQMKQCNRACGIMACHIDTNLRINR